MPFVTKQDLSVSVIERLEAINALSSGLRSATDAAFLAARLPYLTNQVLLKDQENDLIVIACGNSLPTGVDGFKVGALFIDLDSNGMYSNTGSTVSATWSDLNSANSIEEGTPVNAVAATGVLTSDNTDVADGDTVTIGSVTYRFKDTMAQINDVKRHGTTADTTLANLVAAINGSGTPGTEYFTGTVQNPDFSSSTVSAHAITVTARVKGVAANSLAKTETSSHLDWDGAGAVFTGGVDGTVGIANQVLADASYLYHAVAANTISDANWRRISLGSAY